MSKEEDQNGKLSVAFSRRKFVKSFIFKFMFNVKIIFKEERNVLAS